jgi:hypothetical protein
MIVFRSKEQVDSYVQRMDKVEFIEVEVGEYCPECGSPYSTWVEEPTIVEISLVPTRRGAYRVVKTLKICTMYYDDPDTDDDVWTEYEVHSRETVGIYRPRGKCKFPPLTCAQS